MAREQFFRNMSVTFFKNEFITSFANFDDKEKWAKAFNERVDSSFELIKEKLNAFIGKSGEFTDNDVDVAVAALDLMKILKRLENDK